VSTESMDKTVNQEQQEQRDLEGPAAAVVRVFQVHQARLVRLVTEVTMEQLEHQVEMEMDNQDQPVHPELMVLPERPVLLGLPTETIPRKN